ncbi:MAG: hypothetical protein OEV64_02310 [Desulfobulbaceae bacterium]|nr:hypothetical protein [Desulfobulbaceae bacterium]
MNFSKQLVRRIPIDLEKVAEESGLRSGKLCFSPLFGWGVQNTKSIDGPSFGCITPPKIEDGQLLRIENNHWCVYAAKEQGDCQ